MSANNRKFNYAVRANKSVERKMLLDTFRMLHPFQPIDQYKYVGFGSTTFVDFRMVHKALGITKLISIEHGANQKRFAFNKPYRCIEIRFGNSSVVLPKFSRKDWEERTILWLDYESAITSSILADLRTCLEKARPGSLLVISFNIHSPKEEDEDTETRRKEEKIASEKLALSEVFGETSLPEDIDSRVLRHKDRPALLQELVAKKVERFISDAKAARLIQDASFTASQVLNLIYQDNAQMMTLGWLLHTGDTAATAALGGMSTLRFFRSGPETFEIDVPVLTTKEVYHFESFMPHDPGTAVELYGVPSTDLGRYGKLYDYFPLFVEADIR